MRKLRPYTSWGYCNRTFVHQITENIFTFILFYYPEIKGKKNKEMKRGLLINVYLLNLYIYMYVCMGTLISLRYLL